jgi:two-component system cell cycle response regulator DivK
VGSSVLVVEDYDDTRELLKLMLETQGYHVIEADNGIDAVNLAVTNHPDAILMDMSLPGIDGCQAARKIRERPEMSEVPIIACTAHNQWEWRAKAILAGCTDFIRKPVDFSALSDVLHRVLPGPAT